MNDIHFYSIQTYEKIKLYDYCCQIVTHEVCDVIPILNLNLKKGFPLLLFPTIDLQNAYVRYDDGYILIYSDVYYKGGKIKPSIETLQQLSSFALLQNGFFE